jgi:hypothetical protein
MKNMTLSYTRSCFLQETDVPYEGEGIPLSRSAMD